MAKLTASFVKGVTKPGRYGDGRGSHGLALRVHKRKGGGVSRTWIQRLRIRGRETNLGLGSADLFTLAEAREMARANRRAVALGRDPRQPLSPTVLEASEAVIALHGRAWKDRERMAAAWRKTFQDHLSALGSQPVGEVSSADILAALSRIWYSQPTSAKSALQRLRVVIRWAAAMGYRTDDPTAAVSAALPRQSNGGPKKHHAALAHAEVAGAIERVRAAKRRALAARLCFEFVALTAVRSAEARGARWREINEREAVWTIPASRMKAKREHRVPLSDRALAVLREARMLRGQTYVFPSPKTGKPLGAVALQSLAKLTGATVHGLRSSFRTWAGDAAVPREVAEAALAHVVKNQAEAAYARGTLFERRRAVMQEWADYLSR